MLTEKLKKKGYISFLYIIFIIGIVILLFANSIQEKKEDKPPEKEIASSGGLIDEEKLCSVLSKIKGVGDVNVMITYENSGTDNFLSDVTNEKSERSEKNVKKVVSSSGEPVIYERKTPKVKGVVVVCDGAASESVKADVCRAVCALTGVYEHRVGVFEKK